MSTLAVVLLVSALQSAEPVPAQEASLLGLVCCPKALGRTTRGDVTDLRPAEPVSVRGLTQETSDRDCSDVGPTEALSRTTATCGGMRGQAGAWRSEVPEVAPASRCGQTPKTSDSEMKRGARARLQTSPASAALKYSRRMRAIEAIDMPLGHTASHSP